jgi:hypothetical protein
LSEGKTPPEVGSVEGVDVAASTVGCVVMPEVYRTGDSVSAVGMTVSVFDCEVDPEAIVTVFVVVTVASSMLITTAGTQE